MATTTATPAAGDAGPQPFPEWCWRTLATVGGVFAVFNLLVSTVAIYELCREVFDLDEIRSGGIAGSIDAGAVATGVLWVGGLQSHRRELVKVGRGLTFGLVAFSGVLNVGELAADGGLLPRDVILIVGLIVGAFTSVSTLVMSHIVLLAWAARSETRRPGKRKPAAVKIPLVPPPPAVEPEAKEATEEPVPARPRLHPVVAGTALEVYELVAKLDRQPDVDATPKNITAVASCSRATVNRILTKLVEDGIIEQPGGAGMPYRPVADDLAGVS